MGVSVNEYVCLPLWPLVQSVTLHSPHDSWDQPQLTPTALSECETLRTPT